MDVLTVLMIIGVATVAGETVIRVAKTRAGGATRLQAHLDQLQQQCDDQASALGGGPVALCRPGRSIPRAPGSSGLRRATVDPGAGSFGPRPRRQAGTWSRLNIRARHRTDREFLTLSLAAPTHAA